MSTPDALPGPSAPGQTATVHPIVRNALRISLSVKEYQTLHEVAVKRAPSLKDKLPSPSHYESMANPKNRHTEAALRTSLRVLVGSSVAMKLVEVVMKRIRGDTKQIPANATSLQREDSQPAAPKPHLPPFGLYVTPAPLSPTPISLLRQTPCKSPHRGCEALQERNPRVSRALTSRFAPAVGASLAGFALAITRQEQLRLTAAIYWSTRSLEFLFNMMDEKGWLAQRPWWFGSWLLMPISCAQLFHAFVFDRETTPKWFGNAILKLSPSYIPGRPESLPASSSWPEKDQIVDSLASIADLRWPKFVSPILHPTDPHTLPSVVKSISPITGPAHPSITSLSCALLHPGVPNCSTAFLHHILLSVPPLARFLATVTLALTIPKFKSVLAQPFTSINNLSKRILMMTAVLSAAIGSAWGSICLLNGVLPRSTLPTKRFFLSGAIGGLPFMFLGNSRSVFMYFFRAGVDSAWKTGVKRGLWKGGRGGEVWLFVLSWAVIGSILEAHPGAVQGPGIRKSLAWMRGDGWVDPEEIAKRKLRRGNEAKTEN
ncbi:uncharacterized protein N7477_008681 [Penicillium maclennaniae]|uniref:uncharacterized protein n=1 Tax=Penicillium maclennaniae TaxID=1343394 RepID=UPI00254151D2|nr:uncharacterized protein N7477_008681 [Penicillium maclennaniae]KAJ5666233.1 hypothetical protein N7477_008681 [Penicillium maclennaniae]